MRSYDEAELWVLTGPYILNVLSSEFTKEKIWLCHDDGLSCFKNMAAP